MVVDARVVVDEAKVAAVVEAVVDWPTLTELVLLGLTASLDEEKRGVGFT